MPRLHWILTTVAVVFALACSRSPLKAEVVESAPNGFQIEIKSGIEQPPARVYEAFVEQIGEWWDSSHTYSGDAGNLSIDATPQGGMIEKFPQGGFVRHLQVVLVQPGKAIRLTGGLGPLQSMGVSGAMTFGFAPSATDGTNLTLRYNVSGFAPSGLDRLAAPVNQVLTTQVERLKRFAEGGSPSD